MKQDKKDKIFSAALHLFVNYGFHGTSTAKIAIEAGIGTGTLFHYFPTKDDLIVALYSDIKKRMAAYLAEQTKAESTLKETMKGHYLAIIYWALENRTEFRYMELFNASPFLTLIPETEIEKQLKPHLDLLRLGIKDKVIKNLPVDYLYTIIMSQTYGLYHYLVAHRLTKVKQHQCISDTFELLWVMIS